jgi:hypothetical protein
MRGGEAVKLERQECDKEWLKPAGGLGAVWVRGGVWLGVCNRSRQGHHCKGQCLGVELHEQDLNSNLQITRKRCYPLH